MLAFASTTGGNILSHTEITNEERFRCIRRPFPVCDVTVLVHIEAHLFCALEGCQYLGTNLERITTYTAELL